jgi:hypothetical protein
MSAATTKDEMKDAQDDYKARKQAAKSRYNKKVLVLLDLAVCAFPTNAQISLVYSQYNKTDPKSRLFKLQEFVASVQARGVPFLQVHTPWTSQEVVAPRSGFR